MTSHSDESDRLSSAKEITEVKVFPSPAMDESTNCGFTGKPDPLEFNSDSGMADIWSFFEADDDLEAINADDALLDALSVGVVERIQQEKEATLKDMLVAWRRDIDSQSIDGDLVDLEIAKDMIAAAHLRSANIGAKGRQRLLVPLTTAAAMFAITFTMASFVARDAQPGDTLWGLSQVLYTDHARSAQAAAEIRSDLDTARIALREGRLEEARNALTQAREALPSVSASDGKQVLARNFELLIAELTSVSSVPLNPSMSSQKSLATPSAAQLPANTTTRSFSTSVLRPHPPLPVHTTGVTTTTKLNLPSSSDRVAEGDTTAPSSTTVNEQSPTRGSLGIDMASVSQSSS
jgi:hypothetical protein